jgi:hypothetical protein
MRRIFPPTTYQGFQNPPQLWLFSGIIVKKTFQNSNTCVCVYICYRSIYIHVYVDNIPWVNLYHTSYQTWAVHIITSRQASGWYQRVSDMRCDINLPMVYDIYHILHKGNHALLNYIFSLILGVQQIELNVICQGDAVNSLFYKLKTDHINELIQVVMRLCQYFYPPPLHY